MTKYSEEPGAWPEAWAFWGARGKAFLLGSLFSVMLCRFSALRTLLLDKKTVFKTVGGRGSPIAQAGPWDPCGMPELSLSVYLITWASFFTTINKELGSHCACSDAEAKAWKASRAQCYDARSFWYRLHGFSNTFQLGCYVFVFNFLTVRLREGSK